jgi:RNA polymerase sigma factor (sigma-70 family)
MTESLPSRAENQRLFQSAQAGDPEAFGVLFGSCADRVLLYIRMRMSTGLKARIEPEDILQETGLAAFRDIGALEPRGRGAFSRWLCAVAENRIRDARDYHGAQKRSAAGTQEGITLVLDGLLRSATGPLSAAARQETHGLLQEKLEALPEDERAAVVMRFFGGLTVTAISKELAMSESAARRLMARATVHLGDSALELRDGQ